MGWQGPGVIEVVRAQDGSSTHPHFRSGYGRGSVLHVLSGHKSTSQVSDPSSEKSCKFFETQVESNTRCQRQCSADLQPCRHDEEYLRCRMRYRIRHRILYIVYDIVGIHDVVYDIIYCTSYMTSYTMSYAMSFLTTTEIYSAGLTAPASRLSFRVSAPLRLES